MVSWSAEAASFRDLVTNRAGVLFLLCALIASVPTVGVARGSATVDPTTGIVILGAFPLAASFAYLLPRETLMWAVTRPALLGIAIVFTAGLLGIGTGQTNSEAYVQESVFGLVGLIGAGLVYVAIPAAIGLALLMVTHGAGGRSSGPEPFPEE